MRTLRALIAESASRDPSAPAIAAPGRKPLAYGELQQFVSETGARLAALGIGAADRLAVVLPNGPEMAAFVLAVGSHAACAPLNPRYRRQEFEFYLADLRASALVLPAGGHAEAEAAAAAAGVPILRTAVTPGAPAGTFTLSGDPIKELDGGLVSPDTVALLLHTSGTTSRPKLVPLTQANLCTSAFNVATSLRLTASDRCLNIMPLFHIHGIVAAMLASIASAGSIVCTDGVYATSFFNWLSEFRPTWYTAVPTMHQGILTRGRQMQDGPIGSTVRFIRSCSAALAPAVLAELEAFFGVRVVEAYGMTEAAHQMTCNPLPPQARKPGSVGIPTGPEVAIMGAEGELLPYGHEGEVVIRGANVTVGYERNEAANADAFRNGWFRTGDLGRFDDDGYLFLLGRIKEQINRGGEKISPREIDEALLRHPAIAQALAFAVPHRQLGEEIGAAVVLKPGESLSPAELRSFAARELAEFKVPRAVRFLEDIPKGPTGKLQRIGLAAALGIEPLEEVAEQAEYVAPRSETEKRVVAIWRDLLREETIGVRDRFASLGGDSLLAAKMIAAVGEEFGTDAPFTDFLEEGTIESLARDLELPRVRSTVVPLVAAESGTPLVCAPGHDAVLIGLKRVADRLHPTRPVYAVNYDTATTIEALAEGTARSVAPMRNGSAPVLAGVCFGGYVALEAARLLESRHGITAPVVLIDCTNPQWRHSADASAYSGALIRQLRVKYPHHARRILRLGMPEAARYITDRGRAYATYHREMRNARHAVPACDRSASLRAAGVAYRPAHWHGPVLLIATRGRRLEYPSMGWEGILTGPVRHIELPFAPHGAVSEELASQTAETISRYIEELGGNAN